MRYFSQVISRSQNYNFGHYERVDSDLVEPRKWSVQVAQKIEVRPANHMNTKALLAWLGQQFDMRPPVAKQQDI